MLPALLLALASQAPVLARNPGPPSVDAARRVVETLQLAAQEYRLAWRGGQFVAPAEWEEARQFVGEARRSTVALPMPIRSEMGTRLALLEQRLAERFPAESLAAQASDIERRLSSALGVSFEERSPHEASLAAGARIFTTLCASCHGSGGLGDGPVAARLSPPPANLRDSARLATATPLDFYRRVTHGVPGTAMPAFDRRLSREERWDVVAHVYALSDSSARRGGKGGVAVVFGTVRGLLGGAREAAARGEGALAARTVFDAYMAFEGVERTLEATEPTLVARVEERFSAMRQAALGPARAGGLAARHAELLVALADAEDALTAGHSAAGLFAESFLLLLREGFEAILVIGAIMAVLLKAGARERRRDVRWGVTLAIAASLATAAALELLFRVTPAQREALEGGVMVLAAAMLFYASFWLLSKVELAAWTRFVKERIQKAVDNGSGLALAGVAFLAVYREGFETVLFYKALYVTGAGAGAAPITAGLVLALLVLGVAYVGIERFGLRIPMRPFFAVTGATLAYMAVVFAGKGVKELQEGGYVAMTLLRGVPRNNFLGLYPTWESVGLQLVILAVMLGALGWAFVLRPRRYAARRGAPAPASGPASPPGAVSPAREAREPATA
jgi:high-affinity iron transporter